MDVVPHKNVTSDAPIVVEPLTPVSPPKDRRRKHERRKTPSESSGTDSIAAEKERLRKRDKMSLKSKGGRQGSISQLTSFSSFSFPPSSNDGTNKSSAHLLGKRDGKKSHESHSIVAGVKGAKQSRGSREDSKHSKESGSDKEKKHAKEKAIEKLVEAHRDHDRKQARQSQREHRGKAELMDDLPVGADAKPDANVAHAKEVLDRERELYFKKRHVHAHPHHGLLPLPSEIAIVPNSISRSSTRTIRDKVQSIDELGLLEIAP